MNENTLEQAGIPAGATPVAVLLNVHGVMHWAWFGRRVNGLDKNTVLFTDASDYRFCSGAARLMIGGNQP